MHAPAYNPLAPYDNPRRLWPWVVGGAALVGVAGLVVWRIGQTRARVAAAEAEMANGGGGGGGGGGGSGVDVGDTSGPEDASASRETWQQRQRALAYLNAMGYCDCDPGGIDGDYGPQTVQAIMGFQYKEYLPMNGRWTPETEKAVGKALSDVAAYALVT